MRDLCTPSMEILCASRITLDKWAESPDFLNKNGLGESIDAKQNSAEYTKVSAKLSWIAWQPLQSTVRVVGYHEIQDVITFSPTRKHVTPYLIASLLSLLRRFLLSFSPSYILIQLLYMLLALAALALLVCSLVVLLKTTRPIKLRRVKTVTPLTRFDASSHLSHNLCSDVWQYYRCVGLS